MGNRIVMFEGPMSSGKTTLLFKLKSEEFDESNEAMGSKEAKINTHGMTLQYWDMYGREKVRPTVTHSRMVKGYIYVIDSAVSSEKLDDAVDEFIRLILLEEKTSNSVVMVLANKQDLHRAVTALEIEDVLKRKYKFSATSGHTVLVRPCSAKTMDGVNEALAEFVKQIRLKEARKSQHGLLSLNDKQNTRKGNANDAHILEQGVTDQHDSFDKVQMKGFLRNLFCLFRLKN